MDLITFMKRYADEIGGQHTEYNASQSIIIVPLSGNRFQTVIGIVRKNELYNRKLITLSSKVCPVGPHLDLKMLLEQTAFFNYARFVIRENYLQVEAVSGYDNAVEDEIKEMIQEVANLADQYEMKLTGADVN
ncbi:MAG TPA: hypothetical protein VK517_01525 [Cyclobacteriaceae bacterium]|jgi:hypothetical protein|nr:hypothetical protein [Cyclobacteriaceae bacterium]